jgi:hypothetical protein
MFRIWRLWFCVMYGHLLMNYLYLRFPVIFITRDLFWFIFLINFFLWKSLFLIRFYLYNTFYEKFILNSKNKLIILS